jgi:hypothetical protein
VGWDSLRALANWATDWVLPDNSGDLWTAIGAVAAIFIAQGYLFGGHQQPVAEDGPSIARPGLQLKSGHVVVVTGDAV